jgi:hypothetical protein
MPAETLTEKLDTLKGLFKQIREEVYSGRPIASVHDRLLAYSEFETRVAILKSNYTELPESEAQPLLTQLKELELEFKNYGIESAEERYNRAVALHQARQGLELSQPKCTRDKFLQLGGQVRKEIASWPEWKQREGERLMSPASLHSPEFPAKKY